MVDEKGLEINEIEDKTAFREVVQPVYDSFIAANGQARLDKIEALTETIE